MLFKIWIYHCRQCWVYKSIKNNFISSLKGLSSFSMFCHHTHTHPFNGPLSGTTRMSRYQKGKTNLDFIEARDSEWQWYQLGHMQVCTSLQTDNHTSTHHSVFYRPDSLPAAQPTASKQWRQCSVINEINYKVTTLKYPQQIIITVTTISHWKQSACSMINIRWK